MKNHLAAPHATRNFQNFHGGMKILKFTYEKPFSYSSCDEKFSELSCVNEHFKIHIDEKPFSCSLCAKKFFAFTFTELARVHENFKIHIDEKNQSQ